MNSYEITINYANGKDIVVYNSFENIIDMIKNYTRYNNVKNIKVRPSIFLKDKKL